MLLSIVPVSYSSAANDVIHIPDPNLEQAIRDELNKPVGNITADDMAGMTSLAANFRGIEDLTGLQYAVNLTQLNFSRNYVKDISPLANLTNLTSLGFSSNQVSDISSLVNLTRLTNIGFDYNQVSDLSPVQNLTNLTFLNISDNQVSDISSLANLTNLTELRFSHNQVSDISSLANLTHLRWLYFNRNQVSDIGPLANLTDLVSLAFWNNQVSDISSLENLASLSSLVFLNNQVSDISPLANLTNLTWLRIDYNYLDISEGSDTMLLIQHFLDRGVSVVYEPQKQAPVEDIAARIDQVGVTPETPEVGDEIILQMTFTNTGTQAHTFIAGASLWKPGSDYTSSDVDFGESITLAPGAQGSASWTYTVNVAGGWGYQYGVWKGSPDVSANLLVAYPSPKGYFNVGDTSGDAVGRVKLIEPLALTHGPYVVGDTLTATFKIINDGDAPIKLDKLLLGGRFNGGELPSGGYPDFTDVSVTLQPGETYPYEGTYTLPEPGNYELFIAYYIENPTEAEKEFLDENNWNTAIELGEGLTDDDRIRRIQVSPLAAEKPHITEINPPKPEVTGGRQAFAILGQHFNKNLKVIFTDPQSNEYTIPRPQNPEIEVQPERIDLYAGFHLPGTWQLRVVNPDGMSSETFQFDVHQTFKASTGAGIGERLLELIDEHAKTYYDDTHWRFTLEQYKSWISTVAWGEGGRFGYVAHSGVPGSDLFDHETVGRKFHFSTGLGPFQLDRGQGDVLLPEMAGYCTWSTLEKLQVEKALESILRWHWKQFSGKETTLKQVAEEVGRRWFAVECNQVKLARTGTVQAGLQENWEAVTGVGWSWSEADKNWKDPAHEEAAFNVSWQEIRETLARNASNWGGYLWNDRENRPADITPLYKGSVTWNLEQYQLEGSLPTWWIKARNGWGSDPTFYYYYTYDDRSGMEAWVWDGPEGEPENKYKHIFVRNYTKGQFPANPPGFSGATLQEPALVFAENYAQLAQQMGADGYVMKDKHLRLINDAGGSTEFENANSTISHLRFGVGWEGSSLRLEVYHPDGFLYDLKESEEPPIIIEVPQAVPGVWRYRVTGIEIPYADYPFTAMVSQFKPRLVNTAPAYAETAVAMDAPIKVVFDHSIEEVDLSGITLESLLGPVPVRPRINENVLQIEYDRLVSQTHYTVTVPAGSIQGAEQGGSNAAIAFHFSTAGFPEDVELPQALDNMMIIGGIGVSIDLLFDNNELAREKINAALDVDGVSFADIVINFTRSDQFFWLIGRQAPTAGEIASIMDRITGYWDADGKWVEW